MKKTAENKQPQVQPRLTADAPPVDVMLLLEATYPYVPGGVSAWVQQVIKGLPDLSFAIVFVGSRRFDYGDWRYELPANVKHFEEHFLMEQWTELPHRRHSSDAELFKVNDNMHQAFKAGTANDYSRSLKDVGELLGRDGKRSLSREDFFYSRDSWDQTTEYYQRYCTDPSFVDYFWTVRTMHAPLFNLIEIARSLPKARCLHAISTGYAGFLGALASQQQQAPLLITEHGIYTKERRIDLAQAEWIKDARSAMESSLKQDISYVRQMWIRFFEGIGRMSYSAARTITSLYEGNRERQIIDGAPQEKTRIVPNGIDVARYAPLREQRGDTVPPVIGLIGRIAPIKDIKTFIRAMRTVCARMPEAEAWIVGPVDGDDLYRDDCEALVAELGLSERVKFLGYQNVAEILPKLGLIVLSSISEAQPLVVLEGFAAGVPAVTTDVGSCGELIHGASDEDRALGNAGAVVPIANPEKLANAALKLLSDPAAWQAAQQAGMRRVERYYDEPLMLQRYRRLYDDAATGEGS